MKYLLLLCWVFPLFVGAARAACPQASEHLATRYSQAMDIAQRLPSGISDDEWSRALDVLQKASDAGCSEASFRLGVSKLFMAGLASMSAHAEDRAKSARLGDDGIVLLRKAYESGLGGFELGFALLIRGKNYAPDEARTILTGSALRGDKRAADFLARAYESGSDGFTPDQAESARWRQLAR